MDGAKTYCRPPGVRAPAPGEGGLGAGGPRRAPRQVWQHHPCRSDTGTAVTVRSWRILRANRRDRLTIGVAGGALDAHGTTIPDAQLEQLRSLGYFASVPEDPLAAFPRKLARDPSAEGYLNPSLGFYRSGDFPACIDTAQKALELDPRTAPARNNIYACANGTQQWATAIGACERALELDPDYELAKNNLRYARRQQSGR